MFSTVYGTYFHFNPFPNDKFYLQTTILSLMKFLKHVKNTEGKGEIAR